MGWKQTGWVMAVAMGLMLHALGAAAQDAASDEAPALPRVLIIGDSISIGYMEPLPELLAGKAEVLHNPGNAAHSGYGREHLDAWLGKDSWDVIHFNFGLHDIKYVDDAGENVASAELGHIQVPLEQYRENLKAIVARLKQTGAALIFAATTPFPEGVQGPLRKTGDQAAYNAAAREIMQAEGVALNELDTLAAPKLEEWQRPLNVHFTEEGSRELAKAVAAKILEALEKD